MPVFTNAVLAASCYLIVSLVSDVLVQPVVLGYSSRKGL